MTPITERKGAIMVLGATSGAGKSLIATALCRIFSDMGFSVAPFKSQNMSLNSVVTKGGEEISRAQDLQAMAARVEASALMNPILLKPKKGGISQVIVSGHPLRDMSVDEYERFATSEGIEIVGKSFRSLSNDHDIVVIEGAGSPAEINIESDISNMRTAEIAGAQCILVVNMEWGGAFAYAYGTIMLLKPEWRKMVRGIILNNMRGDPSSLRSGIEFIEKETGVPVIGIVPHLDHMLPDEDAMSLSSTTRGLIRVAIIRLPHISNFTDFDALSLEGCSVQYVERPSDLDHSDAIIVPGTKNTISDLEWMRGNGIAQKIVSLAGKKPILGICGGYQMLGSMIIDSKGLEGGKSERVPGLSLLDVITSFDSYEKRTIQVEGRLAADGGRVRGYEIHMGVTSGNQKHLFLIDEQDGERGEGCVSSDGKTMGTYLHGCFDLPSFRKYFLRTIDKRSEEWDEGKDIFSANEESIEVWAEVVKKNANMGAIMDLIGGDR